MREFCCFRWLAVVIACTNWVLPMHLLRGEGPSRGPAALNRSATRAMLDVALNKDGGLLGQVLDSTGRPLPQQTVIVRGIADGIAHQTTTNAQGKFTVPALHGGVFQVEGSNCLALCRCWTAPAAPPSANRELLLVSDGQLQRGQRPIEDLFFSSPVLLGLIIAAAIAIPIAIHNSQDDDAAS